VKLLLDTHVWIWSIDAPTRLAPAIKELVEAGEHELMLSSITFWETVMLIERGKLGAPIEPRVWIEHAIREYPTTEIPVDRRIAMESRLPDMPVRDPADRFIAATARVHDAVLLTHDRALLDSPVVPTLTID
jgi:PIN domain nuclease of toxin-antitoxin system